MFNRPFFLHFSLPKYPKKNDDAFPTMWRRGGLMVSALVSGSSGPGSRPGTLCCVLGQDTLLSEPLPTQVYKGVLVNLGVTLGWTSIPSREK